MEYRRALARREVDEAFVRLRRNWGQRSPEHAQALERADFRLCVRDPGDPIRVSAPCGDADVAVGVLERGHRFTRLDFVGVVSRRDLVSRDGSVEIPPNAPTEPIPLPPPVEPELLEGLDLREEAHRALREDDATAGDPRRALLRRYLLVICFYDDERRCAAAMAGVDRAIAARLQHLRDRCKEERLVLPPEMARLRDELAVKMK